MLNITITLCDSTETVRIDWYGAKPYEPDLKYFLADQYPGASIEIVDPDAPPVFEDDERYEVQLRGQAVGVGSFDECMDYCRFLMERDPPTNASASELCIMDRSTGEVFDPAPACYAIQADCNKGGFSMYRKYFVYLDDGQNVYRLAIPAVSEEAAAAACHGNGTIVAVVDVTDRFPIDAESVRTALMDFNMDEDVRNFICCALSDIGMIE